MKEYFQLLECEESDIPALNILVNSAYRGDSAKQGWTNEANIVGGRRSSDETLRETILGPNSYILKYVEVDEIVGCVSLEIHEDSAHLGLMTVNPQRQGQGLGKKILNQAEEFVKSKGLSTVTISVISLRSELSDWYMRRGFEPTGKNYRFNCPSGLGFPLVENLVLNVYKKDLAKDSQNRD